MVRDESSSLASSVDDRRKKDRKRSRDKKKKTDKYADIDDRDRHRKHTRKSDSDERRRRKKKRHRKEEKSSSHKRKKQRRNYSSSSASSSSSSDDSSTVNKKQTETATRTVAVANERLLAKLAARGETLEERKARKAQKRAAHITAKFGYTAEENPFNDPNLHETFVWKKNVEKKKSANNDTGTSLKVKKIDDVIGEIEKVRQRRKDRELQMEEMERIRAEESRMKELENYDEWARKEEEFHLQQQRQRSAIRLVEGREKPIDVLAKNILLFGLTDEEKKNRAAVKYQERFNAMDALETLEAELEAPQDLLRVMKLEELQELLTDIEAFRTLEREASQTLGARQNDEENPVLVYWDAMKIVTEDEIKFLQSGGSSGLHAKMVQDVTKIFSGQSLDALEETKREIDAKLHEFARNPSFRVDGGAFDRSYWIFAREQVVVQIAKTKLTEIHNKMLVRQLERLEQKKEELANMPEDQRPQVNFAREHSVAEPHANDGPEFGDLEEELGLSDEIELQAKQYDWQDRYRPRKPRYFNRVRTGYDWNKYNQTHYDRDNPPPKIVQGYKFNIFYPDLIDPTKTPQFRLESTDSDEFCIIRFHAGPPYEDVAFKIINREWNKSRKKGYKCTFERGVLTLYFNFKTHWYRR